MSKFIKKYSSWIAIIAVLVVGVLASRDLFKHNFYFNMHDDLQMMRQLELEKCFKDGQVPCRWVPDMGYGFGLPLYNYYPQLPYLFGEIFRLASFPFNDVAKLTFALGIIASGVAIYLLVKEFFGPLGAVLSAVYYMWAPYHAVDVYVRGAMNESWAFVWFPLILWASYKLIKESKVNYLLALSVSIAGLLLTHNLMVMIFAPVGMLWVIGWVVVTKNFKSIQKLLISGLLAIGLSATFTLPAIFEQKFVHIETLVSDYFAYTGHFTSLNQLFFSRFWGDGPSVFGTNDGLAFPIGQVHWILVSVAAVLLGLKIIKSRKLAPLDMIIIFGLLVGTGAAFMTHERATFIWLLIPVLKFVQFPWRFLTLNVLGYSLVVGSLFYLLKRFSFFKSTKVQIVILFLLSLTVIAFNWSYFRPVHSGPLTDEEKLSGEAWRLQTQAGIRDYLPISAKDDPEFAQGRLAEIYKGNGEILETSQGTNWASLKVNFPKDDGTLRVNIFDYPNWKAFVDEKELEVYVDQKEEFGRIYIDIPKGEHNISLKLFDTPLRKYSNIVSLIAWAGLIAFVIKRKIHENKS